MSNRNAASLTGSLLVRKGAAAPSPLGREAAHNVPKPSRFTPKLAPEPSPGPAPKPAQAAPSPVTLRSVNDKPATAQRKNAKPRLASAKPVSAPSGGEAAATRRFTLRLSQDRHLQLRLASVHLGRSGQKLLLEALDEYLGRVAPELAGGNCACLIDGAGVPQLPRTNKPRSKKKPA